MISKFELDAVKNTKAKHLSGGQRKKVSIAMSLMSDPKIILMDEPFQGLDIMSTKDLQETIVIYKLRILLDVVLYLIMQQEICLQ